MYLAGYEKMWFILLISSLTVQGFQRFKHSRELSPIVSIICLGAHKKWD